MQCQSRNTRLSWVEGRVTAASASPCCLGSPPLPLRRWGDWKPGVVWHLAVSSRRAALSASCLKWGAWPRHSSCSPSGTPLSLTFSHLRPCPPASRETIADLGQCMRGSALGTTLQLPEVQHGRACCLVGVARPLLCSLRDPGAENSHHPEHNLVTLQGG